MAYTTLSDCTISTGASDAHYRAVEAIAESISELAKAAQELARAISGVNNGTGIHIGGDTITNYTAPTPDAAPVDDDDFEEACNRPSVVDQWCAEYGCTSAQLVERMRAAGAKPAPIKPTKSWAGLDLAGGDEPEETN